MFIRLSMMRHIWLFLAIMTALACAVMIVIGTLFFLVFNTWGMSAQSVAQSSAVTSGLFIAFVVFNLRFTFHDSILVGGGGAMFFAGLCFSFLSSPLWLLCSAAGAAGIFLSLGFANERPEKPQNARAKAA